MDLAKTRMWWQVTWLYMYKLGATNAGGSSRILDVICEGRTFGMLARVECFVSSYGTSKREFLI